jgi:hypothetical protein
VLLIDEHIRPDGTLLRTHLEADGDHVKVIADDGTRGRLSGFALDKVMRRYGKPLEPSIDITGPSLEIEGNRLTHLRWRAAVDADARDWLVWSPPGEEPVAALSNGVAAALRYLVLRLKAEGLAEAPSARDDVTEDAPVDDDE